MQKVLLATNQTSSNGSNVKLFSIGQDVSASDDIIQKSNLIYSHTGI